MLLGGLRTRPIAGSFSVFFRRPPPTRGAGGPVQLRSSIPARLGKRGSFSPAKDDGPESRRARLSASAGGPPDLRTVLFAFPFLPSLWNVFHSDGRSSLPPSPLGARRRRCYPTASPRSRRAVFAFPWIIREGERAIRATPRLWLIDRTRRDARCPPGRGWHAAAHRSRA
jgi:hypothetical protein